MSLINSRLLRLKEKIADIYHLNSFKDLFIRSVINSSAFVGVLLLIFVLTNPTATTGSIDQLLFLPISILVFTGWIISNYFEDDEKKQIIKNTVLFIGFMLLLILLLNIDTVNSESQTLTFNGFVSLIFLIWIIGFAYTLILEFIIGALEKAILETPQNNE